jgi:hypothetical protein
MIVSIDNLVIEGPAKVRNARDRICSSGTAASMSNAVRVVVCSLPEDCISRINAAIVLGRPISSATKTRRLLSAVVSGKAFSGATQMISKYWISEYAGAYHKVNVKEPLRPAGRG